jgi:hypothetical protein
MSEAANADQQGRRDAKVILIAFRHATAALTVSPRPFGKRGWSERPVRSRINRLAADVDCERDRYRT